MESKVIYLLLVVFIVVTPGSLSLTLTFQNNCPYTVWPGILNNANSGATPFPSNGFELPSGLPQSFNAPPRWGGRFWARTGCTNNGQFTCATGNCGAQPACTGGGAPPITLIEFKLADNGVVKYFYDISLVDGFNVPVSATPQGGSGCSTTSCSANVNSACVPELSVKGGNGSTIACKSACLALNQPQYCCTGSFATPDQCSPTNYSTIFENACQQAYSYAYDDKSSTFTCPTGANYLITFCL